MKYGFSKAETKGNNCIQKKNHYRQGVCQDVKYWKIYYGENLFLTDWNCFWDILVEGKYQFMISFVNIFMTKGRKKRTSVSFYSCDYKKLWLNSEADQLSEPFLSKTNVNMESIFFLLPNFDVCFQFMIANQFLSRKYASKRTYLPKYVLNYKINKKWIAFLISAKLKLFTRKTELQLLWWIGKLTHAKKT